MEWLLPRFWKTQNVEHKTRPTFEVEEMLPSQIILNGENLHDNIHTENKVPPKYDKLITFRLLG